jgi:hypothetical protein
MNLKVILNDVNLCCRKSKSLFQFWKYFTKEKIMLRRKNLLARMIGFHKILFRYFYELKLWVINNKKVIIFILILSYL